MNNETGEVPIQSFKDWQTILNKTSNKVAVLVGAFKALHPDAPDDDVAECGGRIAGMMRKTEPGIILLKMWQTSPQNIVGSHLNYIAKCCSSASPVKPNEQKYNPDKYSSQKFGGLVQR